LRIEWAIHSYRFKVCDNNHYIADDITSIADDITSIADDITSAPMPIRHVLHVEQDVPSRRRYMPINGLQLQRAFNNM
jgi:hypothetical protein